MKDVKSCVMLFSSYRHKLCHWAMLFAWPQVLKPTAMKTIFGISGPCLICCICVFLKNLRLCHNDGTIFRAADFTFSLRLLCLQQHVLTKINFQKYKRKMKCHFHMEKLIVTAPKLQSSKLESVLQEWLWLDSVD